MTAKSSTAESVRAAVIRRPTGAAATARAASTFQGGEDTAQTTPPAAAVQGTMRTTMHLPPPIRIALKRCALDQDTTMGELIRIAISSALQNPAALAKTSMHYHRVGGGVRTTLDLSRDTHRTLKRLAADEDTSVQALVVAAILRAHPDLDS